MTFREIVKMYRQQEKFFNLKVRQYTAQFFTERAHLMPPSRAFVSLEDYDELKHWVDNMLKPVAALWKSREVVLAQREALQKSALNMLEAAWQMRETSPAFRLAYHDLERAVRAAQLDNWKLPEEVSRET